VGGNSMAGAPASYFVMFEKKRRREEEELNRV
jgi:hypothetical protein